MRKLVIAMVAVGALAAMGCEDKKADTKPTAAATAAPAKTAAPGGGW